MSTAEVLALPTKPGRPKGRTIPTLAKSKAKKALLDILKKTKSTDIEGVSFSLLRINPTMARTILELNASNRPLSRSTARGYAEEMKAGRWLFTHLPIAFDSAHFLLDGQHRLEGLIMANMTMPFIIATGLPRKIFSVIDVGMKRSPTALLALEGWSHTKALSAGAQALIHIADKSAATGSRATYTERRDIIKAHSPEIIEAADLIEGKLHWVWKNSGRIGASVAAHVHINKWQGPSEADRFFESLNDGSDLPKGSPILTLRDRFTELKVHRLTQPWWIAWGLYQQTTRAYFNGGEMLRFKRFESYELIADMELKPSG